jgi:uncharacterized RDD family membrane protein YckC
MMSADPARRPGSYPVLLDRLEELRPKPRVAGGLVPRAAALAVDLMLTAPAGQIAAAALAMSQQAAAGIWLALFGTYYVVCHRLWGRTVGKRLLGLRIVGTTRRVRVQGLVLRFAITFWGPLVALAVIALQLGAATDLDAVRDSLAGAVGVRQFTPWDRGTEAILRMFLVPNLMVAIPWLGGFLFALLDRDRQALHDRAARTRVIFEIPEPGEPAPARDARVSPAPG